MCTFAYVWMYGVDLTSAYGICADSIRSLWYGQGAAGVGSWGRVPSRRLEDRIRELCCKALSAQDSELEAVFSELKSALREHTQRLRKLLAIKLVNRSEDQPADRRSA